MRNYKLARKALNQIDADRAHFTMNNWAEENSCGLFACIGGRVMLLSGYKIIPGAPKYGNLARPDGTEILGGYGMETEKLLGFTEEEASEEHGIWYMNEDDALARFRALVEKSEREAEETVL